MLATLDARAPSARMLSTSGVGARRGCFVLITAPHSSLESLDAIVAVFGVVDHRRTSRFAQGEAGDRTATISHVCA